jgi:hypothetical protein
VEARAPQFFTFLRHYLRWPVVVYANTSRSYLNIL